MTTNRILEILGDATGNNDFDSASVVSNADGSVLERLETIQASLSAANATVANDGTVGPSDFNGGTPTILTVNTAVVTGLSGFYVDISGFTNTATLSATIIIKNAAGNTQRQFVSQLVKDASTTLWAIVDSEVPIKSVAAAFVCTLHSDNGADVAVTVPFSYFIRALA